MAQNNSEYDLEKEEYYILEDEPDITPGEDPEDDKEDSGDNDNRNDDEGHTNEHKKSPILLLLLMMINPIEGWKNIRRAHFSIDDVTSRCFYPLIAVAAASEFMSYIYRVPESIGTVLIQALSVFISFFFGYFLILILEKALLPSNCKDKALSDYGKQYVLFLLSTLTLFYILSNCVPMLEAVWVFLPLWTIYLASKGIRFFKFDDQRTTLITVMICAFIILSPIVIYMIFSELLMV